jgi:hypothetical protein
VNLVGFPGDCHGVAGSNRRDLIVVSTIVTTHHNLGDVVNARKPAPIGPLALALRHLRPETAGRRVAVLATVFAVALLAGIALLLF